MTRDRRAMHNQTPNDFTTQADDSAPQTLIARLARHFRSRPGEWQDGRRLAEIGGMYAWRSRCSDCRRPPYNMTIENRQRRMPAASGGTYVVSEYRYVPR